MKKILEVVGKQLVFVAVIAMAAYFLSSIMFAPTAHAAEGESNLSRSSWQMQTRCYTWSVVGKLPETLSEMHQYVAVSNLMEMGADEMKIVASSAYEEGIAMGMILTHSRKPKEAASAYYDGNCRVPNYRG